MSCFRFGVMNESLSGSVIQASHSQSWQSSNNSSSWLNIYGRHTPQSLALCYCEGISRQSTEARCWGSPLLWTSVLGATNSALSFLLLHSFPLPSPTSSLVKLLLNLVPILSRSVAALTFFFTSFLYNQTKCTPISSLSSTESYNAPFSDLYYGFQSCRNTHEGPDGNYYLVKLSISFLVPSLSDVY